MKKSEEQSPAQIVELPELVVPTLPGQSVLGGNMSLLQGVKVKLTVVVGETHTTLGELMALKEHAVLKIDRPIDCPVDVMLDGNVVARGQLVVVDDHFGVRLNQIAASA